MFKWWWMFNSCLLVFAWVPGAASHGGMSVIDCTKLMDTTVYDPSSEWDCAYRTSNSVPTTFQMEKCERQSADIREDPTAALQCILGRTDIVVSITMNGKVAVRSCDKVWIPEVDMLRSQRFDGKCPIHMPIRLRGRIRFVNTETLRIERKPVMHDCGDGVVLHDKESTKHRLTKRFINKIGNTLKTGVVDAPKKFFTSDLPSGIGSGIGAIVKKPFELIFKGAQKFLQSMASIIGNVFFVVAAVVVVGALLYCWCYCKNLCRIPSLLCGICCRKKKPRKSGFTQNPAGFRFR